MNTPIGIHDKLDIVSCKAHCAKSLLMHTITRVLSRDPKNPEIASARCDVLIPLLTAAFDEINDAWVMVEDLCKDEEDDDEENCDI